MLLRVVSCLIALCTLTLSGSGLAYCRQRTCRDTVDTPPSQLCERDRYGCVTEGEELYYASSCLSFTIGYNTGAALGLSDHAVEALVNEAFQQWAAVDCGNGEGPGFVAQSAGVVDADAAFFCQEEPRKNVNAVAFVGGWSKLRCDPTGRAERSACAYGYTRLNYLPSSGEVLDADIELNLDRMASYPPTQRSQVLWAVILHEVGHFLGLAHSDAREAVMYSDYGPGDGMKPLTQDDIDVVCAAFPPSRTPAECPIPALFDSGLIPEACDGGTPPPPLDPTSCTTPPIPARHNQHPTAALLALAALLIRKRTQTEM